MFTGIIESTGKLISLKRMGSDVRICIDTGKLNLHDTSLGDSIAVNGVCLTAIALTNNHFEADVSAETLSLTSIGNLQQGSKVNLELAMRADTRLGGHIVSGHVDGLGKIVSITPIGESVKLRIELPKDISRYVAQKGSITLDGVSLTVNTVDNHEFEVNIVPHTQQETIISGYGIGSHVNIEVDIIARYIERMLQFRNEIPAQNNDESLLEKIHDMMPDDASHR